MSRKPITIISIILAIVAIIGIGLISISKANNLPHRFLNRGELNGTVKQVVVVTNNDLQNSLSNKLLSDSLLNADVLDLNLNLNTRLLSNTVLTSDLLDLGLDQQSNLTLELLALNQEVLNLNVT
jgi:hypothetical protein